MYAVLYEKEMKAREKTKQDGTFSLPPSIKEIYLFKSKKLARKYVKKRIDSLLRSIASEHLDIWATCLEGDFAFLSYNMNYKMCRVPFVTESFHIMKTDDICSADVKAFDTKADRCEFNRYIRINAPQDQQ